MIRRIRVEDICKSLSLQYIGQDCIIYGLNLCNRKSEHKAVISYITSEKYIAFAADNSNVEVLVVDPFLKEKCEKENVSVKGYIVVENPEKAFYDIHDYLFNRTDFYEKYSFRSAIGENCEIAKTAVIEDGVIIGNDVIIGHNTVIRRGTIVEDGVVLGCNNTIGAEGFQILKVGGHNRRIPHVGGLLIKKNAHIGDNNAICNALFEGHTVISENSEIGFLNHIGHNVYVGADVVLVAEATLCGSCIIEDRAWIGVNSSVLNRVTIGADAIIGMGSVVTRDIPPGALAYGVPAKCK